VTSLSNIYHSKSVVLSVICLQPVGMTLLSVADKVTSQERFNTVLSTILTGVQPQDRIILPLASGVSIGFLRDPECTLVVATRLLEMMQTGVAESMAIGIHLGPMQLVENKSGTPNLFGECISVAEKIMEVASNGEILVSRSFYESVAYLSDDHKAAFTSAGGYKNTEDRYCELFRLGSPRSKLLDRLKLLYALSGVSSQTSIPSATTPPDTLQNVLNTIRTWFIPFNALVTFVGLSIAGMERLIPGGSLTRMGFIVILTLTLMLALFNLFKSLNWPHWYWGKPSAIVTILTSRTTVVLVGVVTFMFGAGVLMLSQNLPASSVTTLPEAVPDKATVTKLPSLPSVVIPAASPTVSENVNSTVLASSPTTAAAINVNKANDKLRAEIPSMQVVKSATKVTQKPTLDSVDVKVDVVSGVKSNKTNTQSDKCSEIVMRSSLGIPLSDMDREVLKTICN
jgi:hypothetical protein